MKSVKDLDVYKMMFQLVVEIYKITESFPKAETFGLTSQMRRAAISVVSNLAEGSSRNTTGEYRNFIGIARGSLTELSCQIDVSKELLFMDDITYENLHNKTERIGQMLSGLLRSLKTNTNHEHEHEQ
jgi:four helix bundle protein